MKVAVIGSGIAGLGAAYLLRRAHDVELFERDGRLGGHAHTHALQVDGRTRVLDTGFLVFNERTYPNFVRLLAELGVASQASDMSFSARCHRCGLEYSTRSLRTLFAQPRRVVDPRHLRMLVDILRFFSHARAFLASGVGYDLSLGEWLDAGRYRSGFERHFLLPLIAAVWSASFEDMREFPVRALLQFMDNHGMLSATDNPQWRTVTGGSRTYVDAIASGLGDRVRVRTPVSRVSRGERGVSIALESGETRLYDKVVIATHADQALSLLADPSAEEQRLLGAFRYSTNRTVLHTDSSALPTRRAAWASWNAEMDDCGAAAAPVSLTYHLNRLQSIDGDTQFCVSLNRRQPVRGAVLAVMSYTHPILDRAAFAAQAPLEALNGTRHTFYCGAHLRYGFHEDGLVSAVNVARTLGVGD
jgi:predicted NAD/FAD-binding protein